MDNFTIEQLSEFPSYLVVEFAELMLAFVDKANHRVNYDDLAIGLGLAESPTDTAMVEAKKVLALYSDHLKTLKIADTIRASGFGRLGMKGAGPVVITKEDITPELIDKLVAVFDNLREHCAVMFNFAKGVPTTQLTSHIDVPHISQKLTLALALGKVPCYSFDKKKGTVLYSVPKQATQAA